MLPRSFRAPTRAVVASAEERWLCRNEALAGRIVVACVVADIVSWLSLGAITFARRTTRWVLARPLVHLGLLSTIWVVGTSRVR